MNRNLMITIAVVAGLLGLIFSYLFLTAKKRDILARGRPQTVLVAASHIEPWTRATEDMFRESEIPAEYLSPGVVRSAEEIVGQMSLAPISEGEQITANKFTPSEKGLSLHVPTGKRAFSLLLEDASLFSGCLNPGDRVDVLGTFNIMESEQRYYNFTAALLTNVKVLAVGDRTGPRTDEDKKELLAPSYRQENVISLLLTPPQSVFLSYCVERGVIRLALRSPHDEEEVPTDTVTLQELLKEANLNQQKIQKIREKPSLEIIRGTQKQKERR